ncbi:signal peptidase [Chryseobacterium tongliaoense]|uniref:signal peptidase n=1 Tax=Chryseobacterium tongliaoense TaxID=3240933 RepID=UPI0035132313
MKTLNKLVYALFLFAVFLVNAQPPRPGDGDGGGGSTPGAAPIDMYIYALVIAAVMFIVFFTKKYNSQKI